MVLPIVGGYLLARPSDSGNTDEIMNQVGFHHPEKYKQIHGGKDIGPLNDAVQEWQKDIAGDFNKVANLLDEANKRAGVAWSGQAAEQHGSALEPMTNFIRDSKGVSEGVGDAASRQAGNFSQVKHSMPEPVKVDATDSYLEKGAAAVFGQETDLQKQEAQATEKAAEAKQHYDTYDASTRDASANLPHYPTAPQVAYEQGTGSGTGGSVQSPMGVSPSGSSQPVGGGSGSGVTGGSGSGFSGGGSGAGVGPGGFSDSPAGSGSSWANSGGPAPGGGGGAGAGAGAGTGAGAGGGLAAGMGGAGAGAGGGRGGAAGGRGGAGGGRGGAGAGGRAGGSGSLGAGGRAGAGAGMPGAAGGVAGGAAGGAGGRGGSGAMGGGAGARGQGQGGEEDDEHENKYMLPTDEAWDELGLPPVAPPVFGE